MGFKEVADLGTEVTVALGGFNKKLKKDNPTQAEGYYIGTRQVVSPKSKSGFAALHVLQTPNGNLGVWGKTDLDRKMGSVPVGAMIRVTFVGTVETKNNPMYKYKVEVDADNSITVDTFSAATASVDVVEEETEADDSDDGSHEAQVTALNAAQKAKLEAILGKSVKK